MVCDKMPSISNIFQISLLLCELPRDYIIKILLKIALVTEFAF